LKSLLRMSWYEGGRKNLLISDVIFTAFLKLADRVTANGMFAL
jgi:hypothetical protein